MKVFFKGHPCGGRDPVFIRWIPAFAGMTKVILLITMILSGSFPRIESGASAAQDDASDEAILTFLNKYKENPFTEEGIEAANLAKKNFRSNMTQVGKKLFLEAYALEEHNPILAREKYKQVLEILEGSDGYYQKALKRIRALPE